MLKEIFFIIIYLLHLIIISYVAYLILKKMFNAIKTKDVRVILFNLLITLVLLTALVWCINDNKSIHDWFDAIGDVTKQL